MCVTATKISKFNRLTVLVTPATPVTRLFEPPHPFGDSAASESNTGLVSTNAKFERWVAERQDTWEVPSANNEQVRCIDGAPTSPGTLGIFGGYGVGNPRDCVRGKVHSLVNR